MIETNRLTNVNFDRKIFKNTRKITFTDCINLRHKIVILEKGFFDKSDVRFAPKKVLPNLEDAFEYLHRSCKTESIDQLSGKRLN